MNIKSIINSIQGLLAVVGGFLGWFLGELNGLLYALIAFVVVDYITGVLVALLERRLSSEMGFRGILKKVFIFVLVGIGNIIDIYLLKNGSAIRTAVICF